MEYNTDDTVTCKAACEAPYKLDNTTAGAINCIKNCSINTNAYVIENSVGTACADACGDGSYNFI